MVPCHPSKNWSKEKTFEQLVTEILGSQGQPLHLKPDCFAISEPDELERICGVAKPSEMHLPELQSQSFQHNYDAFKFIPSPLECWRMVSTKVHAEILKGIPPTVSE